MSRFTVLAAFLDEPTMATLRALTGELAWEPGRQGTGYLKAALDPRKCPHLQDAVARALSALGAEGEGHDCYLLRYPPGAYVGPHRDHAPMGLRHARLNALVAAPSVGGDLTIAGVAVPMGVGDAVVFNPDVDVHSVERCSGAERLVLTVGVLLAG